MVTANIYKEHVRLHPDTHWHIPDWFRGQVVATMKHNHVFIVEGVRFLGLGYYFLSTEKNRQVYPVWCSRLHNHTVFIKKPCKKLKGPSKFWGDPDPPTPKWLRPWLRLSVIQIQDYLTLLSDLITSERCCRDCTKSTLISC